MNNIFDIENFNIISDDENYYFFRALNNADNNDLENGIILDFDRTINKIRTNLERYDGVPLYSFNDEISLEQMLNHIKMHQRKDTNCISLTSNANTALTYGRGDYSDKYILVKVPKHEIGNKVYQAGLYILNEIEKRITEKYNNNELDDTQKFIIDKINKTTTSEELEKIKEMLPKKFVQEDKYVGGLEFDITTSKNFNSLNESQNFEKNKVIMKLDILNKQLLNGMSNKFLIQTIGNAFSSLELIHYGEISKDKIIELPKELADIFGLIQQLPNNLENLNELKHELINIASNTKLNGSLDYQNFSLADEELSLDKMYELTKGKVDYKTAYNMYKKSFYLCKSKIRNYNSILLLDRLLNNNSKYKPILEYMKSHTFGIEPEITTRLSKNLISVSESVSLDFSRDEKFIFEFINNLSLKNTYGVMQNPSNTIKNLLEYFIYENDFVMQLDKESWYANSMIDILDLSRLGVKEKLDLTQRNDIIQILIKNNFYEKYKALKEQGYNNKDLVDILFTSIIRNTNNVNLKDLFTLEEFENFIGYNKIKDTNLNLRPYQKNAVDNIDKLFMDKQFAAAILPTGAGKSFVALAEMHKYKDDKILYLAPNNEILNQLKKYVKYVYRPEEHIGDKLQKVIKRKFPNVTFDTYQHLTKESAKKIREDEYDLIVFDELHRTGASEWMQYVEELINNQNKNTRVLGITATPERDVDYKNMTNHWALKLGYNEEEIDRDEHLAINMDIIEAIKAGYIVHPKVVCCEYSLITDGTFDELKITIEDLKEKNISSDIISKYEKARGKIEKAEGIEKILTDNLKSDGKYIVFLPITRKDNGEYEDTDGNILDKKQAENIIKDYQVLMKQYFYSSEYFDKNGNLLNEIYNKINNNLALTNEETDFLNREKENILLLSNINIISKPGALNTKNSTIADKIIDKMNWQRYDYQTKSRILNMFMEKEVNNYSMLGSYSDYKNAQNLAGFNNDKSNKKKLMFVMNKLNEGVHVNDIDGIIWMRPLNNNSRILYLQQLGRCIYSISKKEELSENKRPLVVDLVNNTLKVDLYKDFDDVEQDLMTLSFLSEWIKNNGDYPSINSKTDEEQIFAYRLNAINKKYNKYVFDEQLLMDLDSKRKNKIKAIINIGSNIDLWNQEILKKEVEEKYNKISDKNSLLDFLGLNLVIKDFLDIKEQIEEIDLNSLNIIEWVKELENYCKRTHEWPQSRNKTKADGGKKTSEQLSNWLNHSGYESGNFKYFDVKMEDGTPVKGIIDSLYEQYGYIKRGSVGAVVNFAKELENYCKKLKEWPKQSNNTKSEGGTKTSDQLAKWLNYSGYDSGNFKYLDVKMEDGTPVKGIIDSLYEQYGYIKKGSVGAVVNFVKELENYCEKLKEWPKRHLKIKAEGGTKTSDQLAKWLNSSGYDSGNFKYLEVKMEDGTPIKGIIDSLYGEYGRIKNGSYEAIINFAEELENYCEKLKEWPKQYNNTKAEGGTKTSDQLAKWLNSSGYDSGNFKYLEVKMEDGTPIKGIIDSLYEQYGYTKKGSVGAVVNFVKELENYCEKLKEWPKRHLKIKAEGGTKTSSQLSDWLNTSGYNKGKFKYSDIKMEDGTPVKDIIDSLCEQSGYIKRNSEAAVVNWVKELKNYCEKLKEWPKQHLKIKAEGGTKTSSQLSDWLNTSGYNKGEFKYSDIKMEDGTFIKEIIDDLADKYKKVVKKLSEVKKNFEEESVFNQVIEDSRKVSEKNDRKIY